MIAAGGRKRARRRIVVAVVAALLAVIAVFVLLSVRHQSGTTVRSCESAAVTGPTGTFPPSSSTTVAPAPASERPSVIATARVSQLCVYDAASVDSASTSWPNPWFVNGDAHAPVAQVFLVKMLRSDGWTEVVLPELPAGRTAWVRTADVRLSSDPYRIIVSLRQRRLDVYERGRSILTSRIAVGAAATPTPTGTFSLRVLTRSDKSHSTWGQYAYGLAAQPGQLTFFHATSSELGISGNASVSILGRAVTGGAIRMENVKIAALARMLPLGTAVEIRA